MKILLFLIFVQNVYANVNTKYSLRKCVLLPILGEVKGVKNFDVYRKVELYLKESDWCYYKSNASILTILQSHQKNLSSHLENIGVLRKISDKTKSGSLIQVKINSISEFSNGMSVSMKVIGDNGQDVFLSEKKEIKRKRSNLLSRSIINWLNAYKKTIPYDGQVVRAKGGQFTIDIGSASNILIGDELQIVQPIEKRIHPLLNEVIGWETKVIGRAKVLNVSRFQSQAEITKYLDRQSIGPDNWIIVSKSSNKKVQDIIEYPELKKYKFGQRGLLSIALKWAWATDTVTTRRIYFGQRVVGPAAGGSLEGELWITKNYLAKLKAERIIGSYDRRKDTGLTSIGFTQETIQFKMGYRFLPLTFFWGPQLDFYLGYGYYNYSLDLFVQEGFGHHRIKGWLVGFKGSLPFYESFRGFLQFNTIPFAQYKEETTVFGEDPKSISSYQFEVGSKYYYSDRTALGASFETVSNRVIFGGNNSLYFNDFATKISFILAY